MIKYTHFIASFPTRDFFYEYLTDHIQFACFDVKFLCHIWCNSFYRFKMICDILPLTTEIRYANELKSSLRTLFILFAENLSLRFRVYQPISLYFSVVDKTFNLGMTLGEHQKSNPTTCHPLKPGIFVCPIPFKWMS